MYPVTIQDEDLRLAFLSEDGVQNLIAKIVDSIYTAAEYDEFLLFKYLIIKEVSSGMVYPKVVTGNISEDAVNFRGVSNILNFMGSEYNEFGVKTNTPKSRQVIFMDSMYNAKFDVEVLASAFNMDKAEFMGQLYLIDNFTQFDNERFEVIRKNSDGIEEVSVEELEAMKNVIAVIMDEKWFQVYDNNNKFTEKYVASGLYWNYFYHTWKTFSHSPFSNAVAFIKTNTLSSPPTTIHVKIISKDESEEAVVFTLSADLTNAEILYKTVEFIQTQQTIKDGIAVQPYGVVIIPKSKISTNIILECNVGDTYEYAASTSLTGDSAVGDVIAMAPKSS